MVDLLQTRMGLLFPGQLLAILKAYDIAIHTFL
jgi:hypothetical protein